MGALGTLYYIIRAWFLSLLQWCKLGMTPQMSVVLILGSLLLTFAAGMEAGNKGAFKLLCTPHILEQSGSLGPWCKLEQHVGTGKQRAAVTRWSPASPLSHPQYIPCISGWEQGQHRALMPASVQGLCSEGCFLPFVLPLQHGGGLLC